MGVNIEIMKLYHKLVRDYQLKKIFEYLNTLQKTGITNMFGATPYLYGGREWIQKQIDYFDIEEDENVEKLLDMADEIKNNIISGALKRQEREETNNFIRSVERRVQQESKDILKIWMDFKGKVLKESIIIENKYDKKNTKNFTFRKIIKEKLDILKEETSFKTRILDLINRDGLLRTSQRVNGIEVLSMILQETPEMLLTKYLSQEIFSTDDVGTDVGGYDFKFRITKVKENDDKEFEFYFLIEEGTVDLIMIDGGEYDLLGPEVRDFNDWWEITFEIKDILGDFLETFTDKLKLKVNSIKIYYAFKGEESIDFMNEHTERPNKDRILEKQVKKMIDYFTKDIEFPENFYDFMVDIINDKKYDEKILKVTTVMKKPFSQEDSDKIDVVKRDILRKVKAFFKGMFDSFSGGGTSTLEIYNRDKDEDFYF